MIQANHIGFSPELPAELGSVDLFWVPKDGAYPEQYEDAAGFRFDPNSRRLLLAVADGASDAVLSRLWSRVLVSHFLAEPPSKGRITNSWFKAAKEQFASRIDYSALPWYAIGKLASGSFATLRGIEVSLDEKRYRLAGVGDVLCLVSRGNHVEMLPERLASPGNYSSQPELLGTARPLTQESRVTIIVDFVPSGTTFTLLTDAIAEWFVKMCSNSGLSETMARLEEVTDQHALEELVADARRRRTMRIDDVTLLRVRLT